VAHLRRDRGQIILIAAFVLAITFIAIALVVNSAIFTENLATRSDGNDGGNALQTRYEIEQNVGDIIEYVNRHNHTSHSALATSATESVVNLSVQSGIQNAQRSRVVSVDVISGSAVNGTRLVQNNRTREFLNASDIPADIDDWHLAEDVEQIRAAQFNVTEVEANSESDAFRFIVNDSSDSWEMAVYDPPAPYTIAVTRGDGTQATCTASSLPFTIDVTGGAVSGDPCHALSYTNETRMIVGDGVSNPYTVRYENGDEIEGNYSMVVGDDAVVKQDNFDGNTSLDYTDATYSLTVSYSYESSNTVYNTTVTVAPGEPDD
jgi:hypothetical protein